MFLPKTAAQAPPIHKNKTAGGTYMNITVYLGANEGNDPRLRKSVEELGTWIGSSRERACLWRLKIRAHGRNRR